LFYTKKKNHIEVTISARYDKFPKRFWIQSRSNFEFSNFFLHIQEDGYVSVEK